MGYGHEPCKSNFFVLIRMARAGSYKIFYINLMCCVRKIFSRIQLDVNVNEP